MARRRLGVAAALVDGAEVPGDVVVEDGVVSEVGASPAGPPGTLAVPGFVDLQVNGYAGVDFTATDLAGHRRAAAALAATGVTSFLAALPTAAPEQYRPALGLAGAVAAEGAGAARGPSRRGQPHGARLLGAHLEGPFLAPGRAGAHRPDWLRPPDVDAVEALLVAGPVSLVTLAPELDGALAVIEHLRRRGIVVALGHSDADADTAHRAFDAGAAAVTHLWNAHRPLSARDPGLGGAALARPDVTVCLIADLVHVAPETLRLSLAAARGRVVVVSDAVSPAGLGDGDHLFGGRPVRIEAGAVRLADSTLAGSACALDQAVRNLVGLGLARHEALAAVTTAPARLLGRGDVGRLGPGAPADVVVLDDGLTVLRTLVAGHEVAGR